MIALIFQNAARRSILFYKTLMNSTRNISVRVKQGTVIGQTSSLPNGNPYYAFKGIPYALPPVGELRFQSPVPLEKFSEDELDCCNERDISFHRDAMTNAIVGSEDCLHLNIYTPNLKSDKPLPVMLWIHGGSFMMGSGNSDFYLPTYLIQEDVIVVTLNYRLSMFGFLYSPDGSVAGNAGLKDQLLALKWVNENIKHFNGDPNNVTLFGQSAGASSVHLHVLSENSKKYFHKAICQSGTGNMEWVMHMNPRGKTHRLADLIGFKGGSDQEAVKFLKNQKPIDLLKHWLSCLTPDERRRGFPIAFKPVVEAKSPDAIITKHPVQALKEPNLIDIPIMMGYNSHEGMTMLVNALRKVEDFDQDLARMIPRNVNLEPDDPLCLELAEDIRKFYFDGSKITKKNVKGLTDLMTDYHFLISIFVAVEIHARYQHKSPLYFYRFSYDGDLNLFKKLVQMGDLKGTCHGDDLFYLFKIEFADQKPKAGSVEEKILKSMCLMWTNFAKYSNPTPDGDSRLPVKWNAVRPVGKDGEFILDFLEIDDEIRMKRDPEKDRIDFWRNVYKKYNGDFLQPKF